MSKINPAALEEAIAEILEHAQKKKRNFVETVDLQISLKNYDPAKDKRLSGTIVLPTCPRRNFKVCIVGNEKHLGEAKEAGVDCLSTDDAKKFKKDKKGTKKLAKKYDYFLASSTLMKKLPRLMGPGLSKAGKFPAPLTNSESIADKVLEAKSTIRFQLKSKKTLCMGVPLGNVENTPEELRVNVILAVNKLTSLLKKNWQNIRRLVIKSTMGPPHRIYGF
jgi:large subunit ribosomal protein L10Ae